MIRRRALLLAGPALLAAPGLRAQSLTIRQDDQAAAGWRRGMLVRWGDRIAFDAPAWDPAQPSVEAAAAQFGWDARILAVIAASGPDGVPRALLAVAHPTVEARMAFPGGRDLPEVAGAMQGVSLMNIENRSVWTVVDGGFQNRRLTAATLCRIGTDGAVAAGVVGVTGGCATPWGSLLLTEGDAASWRARLPALDAGTTGMVVELDPADPLWVPTKRAVLGRFGPRPAARAAQPARGHVAATLFEHAHVVVAHEHAGVAAADSKWRSN
jgi:secreted PhoX family phosphatase